MKELDQLIKEFREAYIDAPLYGGYSRTLKRKIDSKQQVKLAFIDNIQMLGKLSTDDAVKTKIETILKSFE